MEQPADVRSNEDLTAATAAHLRWITMARIAVEIWLLGAMVVLARLIPPEAFGMYAVVVIAQELALTMPMEGVGSAIVQRRTIGREHLQGGLALSLAVGAVLAGLTLVVAQLVVTPVFDEETGELFMLAAPWFLLGAVYAIPMAVLRRRLDFRRLSAMELAVSVIRTGTAIVLALGGMNAAALVLGNLAGMTAAVAIALCLAPVPWPRWRPAAIRDLLGYGGPAALACIAWTGFRNGDYAIVAARLGPAQAGFYWRAYQLAVEYQKKISKIMAQVAFPLLARTEDAEAMFVLRRRMVQLLTVVLFPLLTLFAALAPVMIPWVFGSAWAPSVVPAQILAVGGAATLVIDAVGSALQATGRSRALLGYGVAHFGIYAGAVVLVSPRGLAAVAAAASVVHTAFLYVAYRLMLREHHESALRCLWTDTGAALTGSAALAAVAVPLQWGLEGAGAPAVVLLPVVAVAGAAAYAATLRLLRPSAWRDLLVALRRIAPDRALRRTSALTPVG